MEMIRLHSVCFFCQFSGGSFVFSFSSLLPVVLQMHLFYAKFMYFVCGKGLSNSVFQENILNNLTSLLPLINATHFIWPQVTLTSACG